MDLVTGGAFVALILALMSLWVYRSPKVWGPLLGLSMGMGWAAGCLEGWGVCWVAGLSLLWVLYTRRPSLWLFLVLVLVSFALLQQWLPGFPPFAFTPKFAVGLGGGIVGLLSLAFYGSLARTRKDWWAVARGVLIGGAGIALLAGIVFLSQAVFLQVKLPSYAPWRFASNFFLTAIPEEAFCRGFVQSVLFGYLQHKKGGKWAALLLTTAFFTLAHLSWSPSVPILCFVFLAGLLYGGVYWMTGKIESAILTHFILNVVHMTLFSYHAM